MLATSYNKRVSGFMPSALRPNPRFARTSDTHQTLTAIEYLKTKAGDKYGERYCPLICVIT